MAADPAVLIDCELAVRQWTRSLNLPHVGDQTFMGMPKNPVFPLVTMARVAGTVHPTLPFDRPRIQFDVWAKKKVDALEAATHLAAEIKDLQAGTRMGSDVVALDGQVVLGPLFRADDDAGLSRYVLDGQFVLRAA